MADQAPTITDDKAQYELGDTEYVIETPDKPAPPAAPPGESPVIDIGDRPRNPDGTFAPFKQTQQVTAAAVAPPPAPEPERPPQYLVDAARDFGLSDEEINAMPTPVLHKTMFMAQQRMRMIQQQATRQMTLQDGQVRNPEPTPAKDDLDFDLNPEVLHPDLIPPLTRLRDQAKAQRDENRALREEVKAMRTRDEQRELNRAAAIYDAAFAVLGKEFEPVIGTGAGRDMNPATAEYKRRIAILTESGADPRVMTPAQVKAKVKAAADLLYPRSGKAAKNAYAEVEPGKNGAKRFTQQEWEQAGLQRPSARRVDDEPPSEEKAVRNLTAKLNQQEDVIADSEEREGFL